MTIEVIERGPDKNETVYYITCDVCQSKLKFLGKDAETSVVSRSSLGAAREVYKTLFCPVCEQSLWVPR